jgi:hypothetical protein
MSQGSACRRGWYCHVIKGHDIASDGLILYRSIRDRIVGLFLLIVCNKPGGQSASLDVSDHPPGMIAIVDTP